MEIAIWLIVVVAAFIVLAKGAVGLNKKKARDAFLDGYQASDYSDLDSIIDRNSRAVVTTFNIVSAMQGRALRVDAPNLTEKRVEEIFDERWSQNLIMIAAQELEREVKYKGKEAALSKARKEARNLFA